MYLDYIALGGTLLFIGFVQKILCTYRTGSDLLVGRSKVKNNMATPISNTTGNCNNKNNNIIMRHISIHHQ